MTSTIFGKKLLMIATITVLVTGLTLAATTFDDAEAKKGPPSGTKTLKCKDNIGSFTVLGPLGPFVSSGASKCKLLSHASFSTITTWDGVTLGPSSTIGDCILLTSPVPSYGIGKKGFFTFTTGPLEQCFLAADGITPVPVGTPFCGGIATNTWFSTVTGPFGITGGLIKGAPVTGGGGMLTSAVNHCAGGTAPGGNSAVTTLTGTIDFP